MKRVFALFLIFLTATAQARTFSFPRDHGTHEEFGTEWWYFTGHLNTREGRTFGFQWTVFRVGLKNGPKGENEKPEKDPNAPKSAWRADQAYLGHLAVSDLKNGKFYYFDNASREALGLAGGSAEKLSVRLPRFEAAQEGDRLALRATSPTASLNLSLRLDAAVVLHGENGFSQKSADAGNGSYYYSMPQLRPSGTLTLGGETFDVSGTAWMDHEFSSSHLAPTQIGWDWMGLPLTDTSALMIYRLRDQRGGGQDYLSGTYVDASGVAHPLRAADIRLKAGSPWKSPHSGGVYPLSWDVEVPGHAIRLNVRADFKDQELATFKSTRIVYWEGSVSVAGEAAGKPVRARGYLEMTGYAGTLGALLQEP